MHIGDRIAIFKDHKVIELGTPEEIRNSSDPYVQQFLNRQPDERPGAEDTISYLT
jgi:phospholipid/cholesterol/gamma-HCH transport system ATP-binding protein